MRLTVWNEFSVMIHSDAEEAVANLLIELGSAGVSIVNQHDLMGLPEYQYEELLDRDDPKYLADRIIVKSYFYDVDNAEHLKQHIEDQLATYHDYGLNTSNFTVQYATIDEEDWADTWKKYYHPVALTRFLTIVPQWQAYEPHHSDEIVLKLDPGQAFGTGTHPTTQLALQLLETTMRGGETLLDVGTGSGVLSIAAAYMGAGDIYAYDIDAVATRVAAENIALNNQSDQINVSVNQSLDNITHEADMIVANILADIIIPLTADVYRLLKPGGTFITSGIIDSKKEAVIAELERVGFIVEQVNQITDWIGILARKPLTTNEKESNK